MRHYKLDKKDWIFGLALVVLTVIYGYSFFDFSAPPFEDAAMNMRYAEHIAGGYGVVWNIGEPPVDGATDFLFTVILSALIKIGISIEFGARLFALFAHLATVFIIYAAIRIIHNSKRSIAAFTAAYFAIGPGFGYITAFFGTPLFAFFSAITWCFANKLTQQEKISKKYSFSFALSALLLGITRPEGVFLSGLMLLGILYMRGIKTSRAILQHFWGVFIILGGAYFIWHWFYFGYPLPNPFYVKGGGDLYWTSLGIAILYGAILMFPLIPIFIASLWRADLRKNAIFPLIPIAGFLALWLLLSNIMNYLMRFQYAILPIALISWPSLLTKPPEQNSLARPPQHQLARRCLIPIIALIVLALQQWVYRNAFPPPDGRYLIGRMLQRYDKNNYTVATSEAGLIPFYSKWKTIDTWGFNDSWIAHNGAVTNDYLDRYKPELIIIHNKVSFIAPAKWQARKALMVRTLDDYASNNNYRLAAVFGVTVSDAHKYYVRPNFPDSNNIFNAIQTTKYPWRNKDTFATNYVLPQSNNQPNTSSVNLLPNRSSVRLWVQNILGLY